MTITPSPHKEDGAAIWPPVVAPKSCGTMKLTEVLPHAEANKAADAEADEHAASGQAIEGAGAGRSIWHDSIHFTLRRIREPEVQLPRPPKTFWGYIKWHLMPWTRPKLTPEQRWALKQLD